MEKLKQSLLDAPIIEKEGYHYFVHPISDGVPMLRPELLREIVIKIIRKAKLEDVDKIVTPAAMGIHISTAVSLSTDIPVAIIRKRSYGLDGEVSLSQVTGYSESEMYINDVEEGDRIVFKPSPVWVTQRSRGLRIRRDHHLSSQVVQFVSAEQVPVDPSDLLGVGTNL